MGFPTAGARLRTNARNASVRDGQLESHSIPQAGVVTLQGSNPCRSHPSAALLHTGGWQPAADAAVYIVAVTEHGNAQAR